MILSDVAAKRAVISGQLKSKDCFFDNSDIIKTTTFTQDINQSLQACISHIYEKNPDTIIDTHILYSVANELNLQHSFANDIDHQYVQRLFVLDVDISNVRELAEKIKRLEVARDLYDKCGEAQNEIAKVTGGESLGEILSLAESRILDFSDKLSLSQNHQVAKIGEGLDEFLANLKENPNEVVGLSTGWARYDKAIGWLRRGTVHVIAARAKTGKTLIADQVSLHVALKLKVPVLELDTEMDKKGHWPRILSCLSQIPIHEIESGNFFENEQKTSLIERCKKVLVNSPYFYANISGMDFDETLGIIRRWIFQHVGFNEDGSTKDCLIVYDYLKLMDSDDIKSNLAEHQILGFQLTKLNNLMVKYDIPCLTFVQVNRDGINKESTDVIADSDRILRYASSVSLYKEKTCEEIAEDGPENGNRKMIPLAVRFAGGLGHGDYINMNHNKISARITELKTRNEIYKDQDNESRSKRFETENEIEDEESCGTEKPKRKRKTRRVSGED